MPYEPWRQGMPSRGGTFQSFRREALTEDQEFLLRNAQHAKEYEERVSQSSMDFSTCRCVHFWIEDNGFGSEVNNLVSAALLCHKKGLSCIVHDKAWNAGRLHDYLEAEPLILRRCPHQQYGQCRPLEVKRSPGLTSPGWLAVCKHAKSVSMQEKSQFMRKLWQYTRETQRMISLLNQALDLPDRYVAIHIRRGDKVKGSCRECLQVASEVYAAEALLHVSPQCNVIVACSDDLSAAREVCDMVKQRDPTVDVRHRSRNDVPEQLRNGHWQAAYNSLTQKDRVAMTHEFLADVEVLRNANVCVCTYSSNVGRLAALLRDGPTVSVDHVKWTNQ